MKEGLKEFHDYNDSDEELEYYIRIHAEWNEKSFIKMKTVIKKVLEDYSEDCNYDESFIYYCVEVIQRIIDIISNDFFCNNVWPKEFTQENYKIFINERINELKMIRENFINSN